MKVVLHEMLIRMYSLSVWDREGRQYMPVFDYGWQHVSHYERARQAIETNWNNWLQEK